MRCTLKARNYGELAKQALDIRIGRPRDWRIDWRDFDRLIDSTTKLVAWSEVSMATGFQHDLKAICELAHARGALVYADAVQAVGAVSGTCAETRSIS